MYLTEQELVKAAREALKEQAKIPPKERFEKMVRSGLIDREGNVVLRRNDGDSDEALSEQETSAQSQ